MCIEYYTPLSHINLSCSEFEGIRYPRETILLGKRKRIRSIIGMLCNGGMSNPTVRDIHQYSKQCFQPHHSGGVGHPPQIFFPLY